MTETEFFSELVMKFGKKISFRMTLSVIHIKASFYTVFTLFTKITVGDKKVHSHLNVLADIARTMLL